MWRRKSPIATWGRPLLFAWLFFCVALVPVLGFTDVGFMQYSLVADHYQHIAMIAVVAAAAAGWERMAQAHADIAADNAIVVVCALTLLTWQQSRLYGDAITLYQATLHDNPRCWLIENNLGSAWFTPISCRRQSSTTGESWN